MANILNHGNNSAPQMGNNAQPQFGNRGLNGNSIQQMLDDPNVQKIIREQYQKYNGDSKALLSDLIKQNPRFQNDPIARTAQMAMNGIQNPNGLLGTMGINPQAFTNIIHGK